LTTLSTDRWRARISDGNGRILGSGVLITDHQVLTCAHVIAGTGSVEHPRVPVTIDFPASHTGVSVAASVPDDGWFPALASGEGDVAVLELAGTPPEDVEPALLGRGIPCVGRVAHAFGHPSRVPDGVWTEGRIFGSAGPRGEWLQLSGGLAMYDERIEPGFSGGGVKDGVTGRVVGVIVAAYTSQDSRLAWMVPMEVVARYWSPLSELMGGQPVGEDQLDTAAVGALVEAFGHARAMADEARRQQVVHLLPAHVRATLQRRSLTARDTASIVVACLRFEAGIAELADVVRYIEGPSERIRALDRVLAELGMGSTALNRTVPEPTEPLGRKDHRQLLDGFLRLPGMRSTSTRRDYVDMLARYLRQERGTELGFAASEDPLIDVWKLIDRCHGIPGALRLFLEVISPFEGTRSGFGELSLLVEALYPEPLLTDAERDELVELLRGAPAATVTAAHRFSAPRRGTGIDAEFGSVPDVIRLVESYAQAPDRPPRILAFAEYLAHQIDGAQGPLHRWIDRTAARLRLFQGDIRAVCRSAREVPRQLHRYQFIVELAPDAIDVDQYLLSAALQRDSEPEKQLETSDHPDEPAPLPTVVGRVDELLRRVPGQVNYELGGFSVEVVLPRALITKPVDQWQLTDLIPYAVGTRYPVILRSRNRLRRDDLWPQWRRKWDAVKRQDVADPEAVYFLDRPGELSPPLLRDQLWPDDKLLLCLGYPLGEARDIATPDEFAAGLAAGVPVIAWCRDPAYAKEFRQAMTRWAAEHPVRDLARQVFMWRSGHQSELRRHITLVYCDADRVPRQFVGRGRLGPPAQKG
jgi:hypothetical protein